MELYALLAGQLVVVVMNILCPESVICWRWRSALEVDGDNMSEIQIDVWMFAVCTYRYAHTSFTVN